MLRTPMYLQNLYDNYAFLTKSTALSRANHLALFKDSSGYFIIDLTDSCRERLDPSWSLEKAEAYLWALVTTQPLVIMADLEFCDLEHNDSILNNAQAFICEALNMGRTIDIRPKSMA